MKNKEEAITMNVYDVVNDLTKAIKGSHEFKALQEAHAKLKQDADAEKLAQDFLKQKQELEIAQYTGKTPSEEENEKIQKLYDLQNNKSEFLRDFMIEISHRAFYN